MVDRFFSKVDKNGPNGCWLWIASTTWDGYGQFFHNGTMEKAHRVSWEIKNGPILDGFCVRHNCPGGDNTFCVNPDHLKLGTQQDNMDDKIKAGRQPKGKDHGRSKLLEEDVVEIRELYSTGIVTQKDLSDYFVISQSQVRNIVRGLQWK